MKSQINKFLACLGIIFSILLVSNFSFAATEHYSSTSKNDLMAATNQYSWAPASGAVSYTVTIKNIATQESTNIETTETSISILGLPLGNYSIIVTAELTDGSTSIIIEDVLEI